jgi:FlaA1/EpsC-like NDP-sugar epimerase
VAHQTRQTAVTGGTLVQVSDSVAWAIAIFLGALLRYEFDTSALPTNQLSVLIASAAILGLVFGFSVSLYRKRFIVGSYEEVRALVLLSVIVTTVLTIGLLFFGAAWGIPRSVMLISAPIQLLIAGGFRSFLRAKRMRLSKRGSPPKRAMILGAGNAAESLIPQLLLDPASPYTPVVLLDDDSSKANLQIRGIPVAGTWRDLSRVAQENQIDVVIVAIPSANAALLSRVYQDCRALKLRVVVLPTLKEYLGGKSSANELRSVSIEDLVGRQTVVLNSEKVSLLLEGKRVLVTGAGGSIGAELVKQVSSFSPNSLVLLDRDESALLSAQMGLESLITGTKVETVLCDIRDEDTLSKLFMKYAPDVVFHAAALKHVSMLERFPQEAWKTNVLGTWNVLDAARNSGVSVFVNISTDKAANPANVLGKSKKLAEELTAWVGGQTRQRFVSVRFGNVLGSRGSLVPILAEQISRGGPVTVTDKEATRYFMSIPEACQLVLQAASEGHNQEILLLDMGEPVSINEVAHRMIELSGQEVGVVYVGLRPGEKLHEDLISHHEAAIPSLHPRITKLKGTPRSPADVREVWQDD